MQNVDDCIYTTKHTQTVRSSTKRRHTVAHSYELKHVSTQKGTRQTYINCLSFANEHSMQLIANARLSKKKKPSSNTQTKNSRSKRVWGSWWRNNNNNAVHVETVGKCMCL